MIIRWYDHKGGYARQQNFIIRGQPFLNDVVTITSENIQPIPVTPGVPGDVRLLVPWKGPWSMPDGTVTQRSRVFLNRIYGFESRIGTIEDEIDVLDALLVTIQSDITTNTTDIATNAAAIEIIETTLTSLQTQITAIDLQIIDIVVSISAIETRLDALELSNIVTTSVDYQVIQGDIIINCAGNLQVTLESISTAVAPITIASVSGTTSLIADAIIDGATTISTDQSMTLYPARGQWYKS